VLFVLDTCSYDAFASAMPDAKLAGELLLANGKWHDREIWFERNFIQHSERYRDTIYVTALPMMWKPNLARFLNHFHHAEASWKKRGKDKNKIAMRDAARLAKTGKPLFVHLLGGAGNLPAVFRFMEKYGGDVAITAARAPRGTEVPWLWAEVEGSPTDDAERDAIDDAVDDAEYEAQEHPEPQENDARIAAVTRWARSRESNSHRLAS